MDIHYDSDGAAVALEAIARARADNVHAGAQLSELTKDHDWLSRYAAIEENNNRWRLAVKTEDENLEEAILSIQGIVWQKDLPPFSKESLRKNRLRYLKQSISMTGFETASFQASADNLASIYAIFSRCVPPTKLQPWIVDKYEGHCSVHASNRLFSVRADAPTDLAVELGRDIDPDGRLIGLAQGQYFHGDDNKVRYWERITNSLGDHKYLPTSPMRIQVGDVVEAKLSFLTVPLRGDNFKMIVVLRDVTILDGNYAHNAMAARASSNNVQHKVVVSMKRRIGYEDEEEGEARTKLSRMDIDGQSSKKRGAGASVE